MSKIKSVKRNGINFSKWDNNPKLWFGHILEFAPDYVWVDEDIIRNCPLFEVEYEPERWRAEEGQKYYFVNSFFFLIDWEYERGRSTDLTKYDIGNYFKTKEQAQKFIESLKPIFEKFHREEGNYE